MNRLFPPRTHLTWAPFLLAGAAALAPAFAADKSAATEAQARYKAEREACISGRSNQDRATCLQEADAAYAEARRRGLNGETPDVTAGNRFKRCEPLPEADRQACMARMRGQGTTSGSPAAGGVYRELVTPEAAAPASAPGAR